MICMHVRPFVVLLMYRYEEFMDNSSKLNDLEQYSQLTALSNRIGYTITKASYYI